MSSQRVLGIITIIVTLILYVCLGFSMDEAPEVIEDLNLIRDWFWYRLGGYALIVLSWPLICRYLTRPKFVQKGLSEEEKSALIDERSSDTEYLQKMWWKVALYLFAIEIIFVQKLGM